MADHSPSDATSVDAARRVALRLLVPAPLTCEQLRHKLRTRGFHGETVAALVAELQGRGLLDDAAYAQRWLEQRRTRGYGRLRIVAELRERGVAASVAEAACAAEPLEVELATATAAASRQAPHLAGLERDRARAKLARHLHNRGFGGDTIHRVLDTIDLDDD
jgi:regulatory protein